MEKVFIFKNRGTAQVKNIRAKDSQGKPAIEWAIKYLLEFLEWRAEEVEFKGSRTADRFMDFPEGKNQ
jgi:hypothetical protein